MALWTNKEETLLRQLKADGLAAAIIAERLRRSVGSVEQHWCELNRTPEQVAARRARHQIYQKSQRAKAKKKEENTGFSYAVQPSIIVPDHVLADRERRHAESRSLTAWMCGDPVPSRSALAQRQVPA